MIKVLIVEDYPKKLSDIQQVVLSYQEIEPNDISTCDCVVDAKKLLSDQYFDLVVLDIQLPIHSGEDPVQTAGAELLLELHRRSIYHKPTCIMGLSAYDEAIDIAQPVFQERMWSVSAYSEECSGWSSQLSCKIEYLIEAARKESESSCDYKYDLAIITALPEPEFSSVLKLTDWEEKRVDGDCSRYVTGQFRAGDKTISVVATCAPQMGMPATAVTATKLIMQFHPKYICMVGIAAGIENEVAIGDIIVADPSWDWGSGKLKTNGDGINLQPDPLPERLEPSVRYMLQDVAMDDSVIFEIWNAWEGNKPAAPPKLKVGPAVSGACVVTSEATVDAIKEHSRKLIGIEMETYGLMHAASYVAGCKPMAFSLKSVCDFENESKNDDYQSFCAHISAELLKRIALRYFDPV
jgi:nucleoside phosphorylase